MLGRMERDRLKFKITFRKHTFNTIYVNIFVIYALGHLLVGKCFCRENVVVLNKCCNYGQVLENFSCVPDEWSKSSKWKIPSHVLTMKDYRQKYFPYTAAIIKTRVKIHRPQECKTFHLEENQLPINVNFDGQLKLKDADGLLTLIKKQNFCIERTSNKSYVVEVCEAKCSENSLCIRKCCLPHEVIDVETLACKPVESDEQKWLPLVYELSAPADSSSEYTTTAKEEVEAIFQKPVLVSDSSVSNSFMKIRTPKCSKRNLYGFSFKEKSFYLLKSGDLAVEDGDGLFRVLPPNEFCIDGALPEEKLIYRFAKSFITSNTESNANVTLVNSVKSYLESQQYAFICFPDADGLDITDEEGGPDTEFLPDQSKTPESLSNWRFSVFPCFTIISSFFLLVTAIIYMILWKDHGLPGWLQFSYTISLFIAFSFLSVVQLWTQEIHDLSIHLCRALGYSILASFLSVFFWLTCMNIDLYLIFRTTPMKTNLGKRKAKRKFFCFALICVGIPAAIVITAIKIDLEYRENPESQSVLPRSKIGEEACTLNLEDKIAQLYYFYFPVGILLIVNLIFFFCTAACLRERQRETQDANRSSTAADYDRERFQIFTRLFIVMGVLWIFELISWLVEILQADEKIRRLFIVTDILNSLQGVAIFIMFVWKPHTRRQLKQKFLRAFFVQGIFKRNSTQKSNLQY